MFKKDYKLLVLGTCNKQVKNAEISSLAREK